MFYWLHPYYGKFRAKLLTMMDIELLFLFGGQVPPIVVAAIYEFVRVHTVGPAKHANQLVKVQSVEPNIQILAHKKGTRKRPYSSVSSS